MAEAIVVTGLGATTPLGPDVEGLWAGLLEHRSGARRVDELLTGTAAPHAADPANTANGADGADGFATRIGSPMARSPEQDLPRVQARRMDRCEQAALVAARQAWGDAGEPNVDPLRLAVVVGTGVGGVGTLLAQDDTLEARGPDKVATLTVPMLMPNGPAAWIAIEFGARAGTFTPVSACASGAEALAQGARMIRAGQADVVIAGGAEAAILPLTVAGFTQARTLSTRNDSPEHASRPFDRDRDGFVLGEGAGVMVLESARHATARGATVHGRLAGTGITSDAHHITGADPTGAGQIRAMHQAIADAELTPGDVAHVDAHATSTRVGDRGEAAAITAALGAHVAVTAPKASLGHLVGAAGAVEAIITLLAVTRGIVPPTRNLDELDPEITLDVVTTARSLAGPGLSNAFGFGGQNVSLLFTAA